MGAVVAVVVVVEVGVGVEAARVVVADVGSDKVSWEVRAETETGTVIGLGAVIGRGVGVGVGTGLRRLPPDCRYVAPCSNKIANKDEKK